MVNESRYKIDGLLCKTGKYEDDWKGILAQFE